MELSKGLSKELSVREEWWWCYMEWEVGWVSPFLARAKPFPIYFKIYIETCVSSAGGGHSRPLHHYLSGIQLYVVKTLVSNSLASPKWV